MDYVPQQKLSNFFPEIIPSKTFEPLKTTREERGKAIAESFGNMRRIDDNHYEVKSQSKEGFYSVGLANSSVKAFRFEDYSDYKETKTAKVIPIKGFGRPQAQEQMEI